MTRIISCTHVEGRTLCANCLRFNVREAISQHPKTDALIAVAREFGVPVIDIKLAEPIMEQR